MKGEKKFNRVAKRPNNKGNKEVLASEAPDEEEEIESLKQRVAEMTPQAGSQMAR
jgi:hypothetical protein